METRKNRSSVFDLFLVSVFLGLLLSRAIYVFENWNSFSGYIWYWSPYERYGSDIYWLRLLPWRFFNIFDGGLNILVMFVGFLLSGNIWSSLVKKWQWSHMFPTIYFTGESMLAISFLLLGLSNANTTWIYEGLALLAFPIISIALIRYVNKIEKPIKEKRIYMVVNSIEILLSSILIAYIYISGGISIYDKVTVIVLLVWIFFGLMFFLKDLRKANVVIEKISSVRTIDANQPIKL